MSYRITLGFDAKWAEFCCPRDGGLDEAVAEAERGDAKVIALDEAWRSRFMQTARENHAELGCDGVRLAGQSDLQ